jgi:hypothetical protein
VPKRAQSALPLGPSPLLRRAVQPTHRTPDVHHPTSGRGLAIDRPRGHGPRHGARTRTRQDHSRRLRGRVLAVRIDLAPRTRQRYAELLRLRVDCDLELPTAPGRRARTVNLGRIELSASRSRRSASGLPPLSTPPICARLSALPTHAVEIARRRTLCAVGNSPVSVLVSLVVRAVARIPMAVPTTRPCQPTRPRACCSGLSVPAHGAAASRARRANRREPVSDPQRGDRQDPRARGVAQPGRHDRALSDDVRLREAPISTTHTVSSAIMSAGATKRFGPTVRLARARRGGSLFTAQTRTVAP